MPTTSTFRVERWAAWAAGLETQDAWRAWLIAPHPLPESGQPPLAEMPAMMRRRIEPLGRAALQAAYWAQGEDSGTMPVVMASRWGEIARSLTLLGQLSADEPLSPTHFSLSVHNATGALYSMARQDRQNYLAVAGGAHSVESGVCESLGLLADGAARVLLVSFDAPLPAAYAALGQVEPQDTEPMTHGWACVLTPARADEPAWSLQALPPSDARADAPRLPGSLAVLELLSREPRIGESLDRPGPSGGWRWSAVPG